MAAAVLPALALLAALGMDGCSFDRISCATSACPQGLVCNAEKRCTLAVQTTDGPPSDADAADAAQNGCAIVSLSLAADNSCAVRADRTLFCWGENSVDQLPISDAQSTDAVAIQSLRDVSQVAVGWGHICAIASNGSSAARVFCWGPNGNGELGRGSAGGSSSSPAEVLNLGDAVEVVAGGSHTCARKSDRAVYCWGDGARGQNGSTQDASAPRRISVTDIVQLAAGHDHTCALDGNGNVFCWGGNYSGQLGNGSTSDSAVPYLILAGAVEVAAGWEHTCARKQNGSLLCWGKNGSGQLGQPSSTTLPTCPGYYSTSAACSTTPLSVEIPQGFTDPVEIAAGELHTCARTAAGDVWCWGNRNMGQLGDNSQDGANHVPALVVNSAGFGPASKLSLGDFHSCAIGSDGRLWCWGQNELGQLGARTTSVCSGSGNDCSPVPIAANFPCP